MKTEESFRDERTMGRKCSGAAFLLKEDMISPPALHLLQQPDKPTAAYRPALAAEPGLTADLSPAPAPRRTQGVRGAADTSPGTHNTLLFSTHSSQSFTLIELLVRTTC